MQKKTKFVFVVSWLVGVLHVLGFFCGLLFFFTLSSKEYFSIVASLALPKPQFT